MTKVISAVAALLLLTPALFVPFPVMAALGPLILLATYAWSPQNYEIRGSTLIVRRLARNVRIPLDAIQQVRAATADDLTGCVRLFGSGGLFGWYGLFRTARLGKSTWYVTSRRNAVVLVTERRTLVVSPDDIERFVNAIRLEAPQASAAAGESVFTYDSGSSAGFIAVALVAAVVIVSLFYSPGPPAWTLTPTALTIHDRFYPVTIGAASVDVSGVRVVDISTDKQWQPTMRTNGFGNLRYHAGWFRVENGRKVRMYRADGKKLVLLPPAGNGSAVLLQTRDPEQFVREVHEEWSAQASVNRPE